MTDFELFDDGIRTLALRLTLESKVYSPLPNLSIVVQANIFHGGSFSNLATLQLIALQ